MVNDKLVYSTASDVKQKPKDGTKQRSPSGGPCKMRLETKGRGGKAVTVLFNLPWDKSGATALMRSLQVALGCGGSYKEGNILFQGDVRDKVEKVLKEQNIKVVRAGG